MAKKDKEKKDSFTPVDKIETKKDIPPVKKLLYNYGAKESKFTPSAPSTGDLELNEINSRKNNQKKLSLSNLSPEPELMPMREKEILSRQDQKAKQLVESDAKRSGVKLNWGDNATYNLGRVINPATPKTENPDNLTQAVKNSQSKDPAIAAKGYMDLKGKAPQQQLPEQDNKQLLEDAKKQRKARWGDALTGFGQVMQGKTVNTDNWETSKLQRKRDEQFQEYKDITEKNQKVKEVWDAKNREDLINFLETQQKTRDLNERESAKLAEAKYIKDRDFALKAATEAKKWESGYYNKHTSSEKTAPKINLPFDSEIVLSEMNNLAGGGAGVGTSNRKRLEELITTNPTGYNMMLELSGKTTKLRKQIAQKQDSYNAALKEGNSSLVPQLQADIDTLNKELDGYETSMKTILSGKGSTAAAPAAGTPATAQQTQAAAQDTTKQAGLKPETQKAIDDFFN